MKTSLCVCLVVWVVGAAEAFQRPQTHRLTTPTHFTHSASTRAGGTARGGDPLTVTGTATTLMADATGWDNFCIENLDNKDLPPEEARRFRRTVYTHDDWKKHRSQDRFFIYLGSLFDSGVFKNSEREVYLCTAIATVVCVYNAVVGGYTDLAGIQHDALIPGTKIGIPMTAFTVTSSSLGLLLSKWC